MGQKASSKEGKKEIMTSVRWHDTNRRERHLKRDGRIIGKLALVGDSDGWLCIDSIRKKELGERVLEHDARHLVEKVVLTGEEKKEMDLRRLYERVLKLERRVTALESERGTDAHQ